MRDFDKTAGVESAGGPPHSLFQEHDKRVEQESNQLTANKAAHNLSDIPIHNERSTGIQAKLTVNTPGDKYEREADAIADKITGSNTTTADQTSNTPGNPVRRKPMPGHGRGDAHSGNETTVNSSLTNRIASSWNGGQAMNNGTGSFMSSRFGFDFSNVKIHTDSESEHMNGELQARAFTVGHDIYFNKGQYDPGTDKGKHLLAHELTHVAQQGTTGLAVQRNPIPPSYGTKTGVPDESKVVIDTIPYFRMNELKAPLNVNVAINEPSVTNITWELYDPNDKSMPGGFSTTGGTPAATKKPFPIDPANFSGSGSPEGKYILRCTGLNATHEPLFYADREFYVYSASFNLGTSKGLKSDPSRPSIPDIAPSSIKAYFFPGTSQERSLVIGGVHGSEQSGIEVVDALKKLLEDPKLPKPYFNTILIPVLFPDNYAYDKEFRKAHPKLQGKDQGPQQGGRYTRLGNKPEDLREPNRNYPTPGTSLDTALSEDATKGGRDTTVPPPTGTTKVKQPLLPETKILLSLIQQFRPSRIASVHAHRPSTTQGDAPGIYVDPRKDDPKTPVNETDADDALAKKMLALAKTKKLKNSNPNDDVHYAASHPVGASLGDWAPAAVDEGKPGVADKPGDRPGITTITVEVEGYSPASEDPAAASKIQIHSETLLEVFLARP